MTCKHVSAGSLPGALEHGGRYFDGERWICVICDDPRGLDGYVDRMEAARAVADWAAVLADPAAGDLIAAGLGLGVLWAVNQHTTSGGYTSPVWATEEDTWIFRGGFPAEVFVVDDDDGID